MVLISSDSPSESNSSRKTRTDLFEPFWQPTFDRSHSGQWLPRKCLLISFSDTISNESHSLLTQNRSRNPSVEYLGSGR